MTRSPLQAIRAKCLDCCLESSAEVKLCASSETCPLYPFRFRHSEKGLSPLKTIRAYCLGCGEGPYKAVKDCPFTDCPLYPFRLGTNPNIPPRKLSDSEREILAERMKAIRKTKVQGTNPEKMPTLAKT